jgi:uncharacterized cupin superfamily protein
MEIKVQRLSEDEIAQRGIRKWPIWQKEPSRFDWSYDSQEQCLFLEGEVVIHAPGGQQVKIQAGDFVTFPEGLKCVWEVRKQVKKHYQFG